MATKITTLPTSEVQLDIEVTVEEMKPFLEKAAEELSLEHKIEGFRPGKASLGIVLQKMGAQAVWQEAAELSIRAAYVQAVSEHKLAVIGSPKISITKLAPDNPFTFTATAAVLPEVTLGQYDSFSAKRAVVEIADDKIEQALKDLQTMFAKEVPVERAAQMGDKVEVDFDIYLDHVLLENGSSKQHPVVLGEGNFLPDFESNIVGLKKDEQKEFTLTFPKDYHQAQVAGKEALFKVTVKSVNEIQKPALDTELAKRAGNFSSLEELRAKVKENLLMEAEQAEDRRLETAVVDELLERTKFGTLPELLITSELDKMIHELQDEIAAQSGIPFEQYLQSLKKTVEELRTEFRPQAERRVKASLAIRTIADQEHIEVDAADIEKEVTSTLAMYSHDTSVKQRIDSRDYRDYLRHVFTNRQVIAMLKDRAVAPPKA